MFGNISVIINRALTSGPSLHLNKLSKIFSLHVLLKQNIHSTGDRLEHRAKVRPNLGTDSNQIKLNDYKILKQSNDIVAAISKDDTISENLEIELDDVEINLDDQTRLVFNLTWLRDSCHCNLCTHQYSRQRTVSIRDFRRDNLTIVDMQLLPLDDNEHLKTTYNGPNSPTFALSDSKQLLGIKWSDGHESLYSLDWLLYISNMYPNSKSRILYSSDSIEKFDFPKDDFYGSKPNDCLNLSWNVEQISNRLKPVDYSDLIDGFEFDSNDINFINKNNIANMSSRRFEALWTLSNQLVVSGLAKIVNVPQERNQVLNVARSLAYERATGYGTLFDVVVEPSEEINLAYSALEFDLHSDLVYREMSPGVQLLHCIRNSTVGGLSYFSDALNATKILQQNYPVYFKTLTKFPASFSVVDPYRNTKFRNHRPILGLDLQGNFKDIYYSPFMLPPVGNRDDIKLFYLALNKLNNLLHSTSNKLVSKLNPGELFIFHNRRVLHGRSAYDPTQSRRFLQGCYIDWDEIGCLHEKLHSQKTSQA